MVYSYIMTGYLFNHQSFLTGASGCTRGRAGRRVAAAKYGPQDGGAAHRPTSCGLCLAPYRVWRTPWALPGDRICARPYLDMGARGKSKIVRTRRRAITTLARGTRWG